MYNFVIVLVDLMQKLTGVITESCLDDHEQIEISSSPLKDDYDDSCGYFT